jgi:hypothetical protein
LARLLWDYQALNVVLTCDDAGRTDRISELSAGGKMTRMGTIEWDDRWYNRVGQALLWLVVWAFGLAGWTFIIVALGIAIFAVVGIAIAVSYWLIIGHAP